MSWLYVPGLAASTWGYSLHTPPLVPSVTWRTAPMQQRVWSRKWSGGGFVRRLSGVTLEPSTAQHGVERWIASLRATRASHLATPAKSSEPMTLATYGQTSDESSQRSSPLAASSKMSPVTCGSDLTVSMQTCEILVSALMSRYAARRKSAHHIAESECSSLLPTPTASSYGSSQNGQRPDGSTFMQAGKPSLATMAKRGLLPTPMASDGRRGLKDATQKRQGGMTLPAAIGALYPTPTAGDANRSGSRTSDKNNAHAGTSLTDALIRHTGKISHNLNPRFVEWMMGLPIGWSDYEP